MQTSGNPTLDNPTNLAQNASEPLERNLSQEPSNSSIRTMLLALAGASVAGSLIFQLTRKQHEALFVGQWAPTLVSIALWYQIVKAQEQR